jgi:hypothetical protein
MCSLLTIQRLTRRSLTRRAINSSSSSIKAAVTNYLIPRIQHPFPLREKRASAHMKRSIQFLTFDGNTPFD